MSRLGKEKATLFLEKYLKAVKEKRSIININLDPALPRQRTSNVVPARFVSDSDEETLENFCIEIIEQVSDYCCAVKPNTQYFLGAFDILPKLVGKIQENGMIAILDHKLSDIDSTNDSALFWVANMGFDAFTFSPFPGNMKAIVTEAHKRCLGAIALTLMSNPEAEKLMINTAINGEPYYLHIAREVANFQADGCVVGLTSFVRSQFIKNVQDTVGDRVVFLMQGIGPQGGRMENIRYVMNPLVSLGRGVIYSQNPRKAIIRYHEKLSSLRCLPSL
jgi:orotidine-5'-phosphate decarboxylase